MEKIEKPDFKLKKGNFILLKSHYLKNDDYIGVVRNYDNKKSLSGCFSKGYIKYNLSINIEEVNSHLVFCWYKDGFIILRKVDGQNYLISELSDLKRVDLFKLNEEEKEKFKSLVIKTKIANSL